MPDLSIGELSRRFDLRPSALRYYEEIGLLNPVRREAGRRRYDESAAARLRVIRLAQSVGFTLAEIQILLDPESEWRALSEIKLLEMQDKINQMHAMRKMLKAGLECDCIRPETCGNLASDMVVATD